MDYEFTIDEDLRPLAKFSIGHEAIGRWLSDELASHHDAIADLLDKIREIENKLITQHRVNGREFDLQLNVDEIEVVGRALDFDVEPEDIPDNANLYDQEHRAECGLQDFKQVVLSWQIFVHGLREY